MSDNPWPKIFRSLRQEDLNGVNLLFSGGLEITIQELSRIEEDVVMIRGRIAGQPDGGRLIVVPYGEIKVMYANRMVKKEEIELYSPSVSLERKNEVAAYLAELAEKAKQEAAEAEQMVKDGAQQGVPDELKKQLEELRKAAFGPQDQTPQRTVKKTGTDAEKAPSLPGAPAGSGNPTLPGAPAGSGNPTLPGRPSGGGNPTLPSTPASKPTLPNRPGSGLPSLPGAGAASSPGGQRPSGLPSLPNRPGSQPKPDEEKPSISPTSGSIALPKIPRKPGQQ